MATAGAGPSGVGLVPHRVPLPYPIRPVPTEEEQPTAILRGPSRRRPNPAPLTIRTLDLGGDKNVPYLGATSARPTRSWAGGDSGSASVIRLFKAQLRAIVRLGMQHPVTVLFPMVTTIDELRAARGVPLAEVATEVGCPSGLLPAAFEVGAMAEVPAFRPACGPAAVPLVDLISVGSNDLTQYTTAAET